MNTLDLINLREVLKTELPRVLREYPEARHELWGIMLEAFPSREEFAALLQELRAFREESNQRFEQQAVEMRAFREDTNRRFEEVNRRFEEVNRRFESMENRMDAGFKALRQEMGAGFKALRQDLDRLGQRWGIRNESVFRQTIAALLEKSFGAQVQTRFINGEQYDVIISDGAHILLEITASAGTKIQERLERKRHLYSEVVGVVPARVVLATASIHSQRAQALRAAGFEVIEPEEEALE